MESSSNSTKKRIRILGLLNDIPLVEKGVSGSRSLVYNHLKDNGYVTKLVDVDLTPAQKYFSLIKNVSRNSAGWKLKNNLDVYGKHARTSNLKSKLSGSTIDFDATLQIGSTFNVHDIAGLNSIPNFSYHDNNVMLYFNSGFESQKIEDLGAYSNFFAKAFEFEKTVYDNLTAIFCMTEYLRNSFIRDFHQPEEKVHAIGFGTNLDARIKDDFEKDYSARKILFVAKDSFIEKGGLILLEAFKTIKSKYRDAELIIVGPKQNYDSPGVIWTGLIDKRIPGETKKLINIYKEASVFVLPSFGEPAGNVFLEAMAYKLPCIGANQGATSEIIVDNKCGQVVDKDASSLAEEITIMFENEQLMKQYGESGRATIRDKYNWDTVCQKAIDIMSSYC